jgi:DNA repair exonuclease SbcCD ATPase subunit
MIIITEATKEILKWTMISLSTAFIAFIGGSFILGELLDIYSTTGKKKDIDNDFTSVEGNELDTHEGKEIKQKRLESLNNQKKEKLKEFEELKILNEKEKQEHDDELVKTLEELDKVELQGKQTLQMKKLKEIAKEQNEIKEDQNKIEKKINKLEINSDKQDEQLKKIEEGQNKNKEQKNKIEKKINKFDKSWEKINNSEALFYGKLQEVKDKLNTYVAKTGIIQTNNIGSGNNV